jgi:hypothetical protein
MFTLCLIYYIVHLNNYIINKMDTKMTHSINKSYLNDKASLSYSSSSGESKLSYSRSSNSGNNNCGSSITTSETVRKVILDNCMYRNRPRIITAEVPIENKCDSVASEELMSEKKQSSVNSEINKVASIFSAAQYSTDSDAVARNDALNLFVALQKKRSVPEEHISKIVSELQ